MEIGTKINSWTIVSDMYYHKDRKAYDCQCKCGVITTISKTRLNSGNSKSCLSCAMKKHGHTKTRLYNIWRGIKSRCLNPKATSYNNYGGRGITICKEWLEYMPFHEWAMNNHYDTHLVCDRKENNGPYSPDNCHWTTDQENSKNTRRTNLQTAFGETKCFEDWTRDPRCRVHCTTLRRRLKRGMVFEQAIQ